MNFLHGAAAWADGHLEVHHTQFDLEVAADASTPLRGRVEEGAVCMIGVRPEDVGVRSEGGIPATVVTTEPLGGETVVDLELGDRITKALVDPTLDLADGQATTVALDVRRLHLFDHAGEALLSAAGDDIFGVRVR